MTEAVEQIRPVTALSAVVVMPLLSQMVAAYGTHKLLPTAPYNDATIAIMKFPNNVIGKPFDRASSLFYGKMPVIENPEALVSFRVYTFSDIKGRYVGRRSERYPLPLKAQSILDVKAFEKHGKITGGDLIRSDTSETLMPAVSRRAASRRCPSRKTARRWTFPTSRTANG